MTYSYAVVDGMCQCHQCGEWESTKSFISEGLMYWCSECERKRRARIDAEMAAKGVEQYSYYS